MEKLVRISLVAACLVAALSIVSCGGGSSSSAVKSDSAAAGPSLGPEMIKDGNFPDGSITEHSVINALSDAIKTEVAGKWNIMYNIAGKGKVSFAAGVARVEIANGGTENWHIQLVQTPIKMSFGKKYRLSFDAKGDKPRNIMVKIGKIGGDWLAYSGLQFFDITDKMANYTVDFKSMGADDWARMEFELGASPVSVELANVSLKQIQ